MSDKAYLLEFEAMYVVVEPDYEAARDTLAFAVDSEAWENLPVSQRKWLERAAKLVVDAALAGRLVVEGSGE